MLEKDLGQFDSGMARSDGVAATACMYRKPKHKPKGLNDPSGFYMLEGTRSGEQLMKRGVAAGMTALDVTRLFGLNAFVEKLEEAGGQGGGPPGFPLPPGPPFPEN